MRAAIALFACMLACATPAQEPDVATPELTLSARLLDWQGEPVRNTRVGAFQLERWPGAELRDITGFDTDSDGRFTWSMQPVRRSHAEHLLSVDRLASYTSKRGAVCRSSQLVEIPLDRWLGRPDADLGDVRMALEPTARIRAVPPPSDDELEAILRAQVDGPLPWHGDDGLAFEACLSEMGRRGGERWSRVLTELLERAHRDEERDARLRAIDDVVLWTALRRAQGKPDPVRLEVDAPLPLTIPFPTDPVVPLALVNVDAEGIAPRVCMYWGWRQVHVQAFEGDRPVPRRVQEQAFGSWSTSHGTLEPGERSPLSVHLRTYILADFTSDLRLTISYSSMVDLVHVDDPDDIADRVLLTTEPFELRWSPLTLRRADVEDADVATAFARIDPDARVVLAKTVYAPGLDYRRDGSDGEEGVLEHGLAALPGLLDLLERDDLSFEQRAWVLGLLYDLTGVLDPRLHSGTVGRFRSVPGFDDGRPSSAGFFYADEAPSIGLNGRDPAAQDELVQRWRALRPLVRVDD